MQEGTVIVWIKPSVRDELKKLKWDMRTSSLSDVIERLIREYESRTISIPASEQRD
jgi:predicted CopG family antitoxin